VRARTTQAIKPIRLPTRGAEPISRRLDLIGIQTPTPRCLRQAAGQLATRPDARSQTTSTSKHTSAAHRALIPASSCAYVAPNNSKPAGFSISTSCFSAAQSIPAQLPITPHIFPNSRHTPNLEAPLRALIDRPLTMRLRPVAARDTSPPPGRTGLHQALHTRASGIGPLPAAAKATTDWPMSGCQHDRRATAVCSSRGCLGLSDARGRLQGRLGCPVAWGLERPCRGRRVRPERRRCARR